MNTRQITVSFVVKADGQVTFRDLPIEWIASDDVGTIADVVKDAILNIE